MCYTNYSKEVCKMVDKLNNLPYSYQEDIKKATQILKENGINEEIFLHITLM